MPSARELLEVWEASAGQPPVRRDLALLRLAGAPAPAPAETTAGRLNVALLAAREAVFGACLPLLDRCPACGADVEFEVDVRALRGRLAAGAGAPPTAEADGWRVEWRLPTLADLAELPAGLEADPARAWLAQRCLLRAADAEGGPRSGPLPGPVVAAMAAAMAAADPAGELEFDLQCPACRHRWISLLDPGAVVAAELDDLAGRILGEIHVLAAAYGWREDEILALSAPRRRAYLQLLGAA